NLWPALRERLQEQVGDLTMGDVTDFSNFMGAVIDGKSFETQKEAIEEARSHVDTEVLVGGEVDDSDGWFVRPTVVATKDPQFRLLRDELFGPAVPAYVYQEGEFEEPLELLDNGRTYGVPGAVVLS